jgi:hypothetical protein
LRASFPDRTIETDFDLAQPVDDPRSATDAVHFPDAGLIEEISQTGRRTADGGALFG